MQNIEQNKHISEELWIALSDNTIRRQDYMKILEHTCGCTWCAEHLAQVMEGQGAVIEPPAYLREEILERAARLDVRAPMSLKRKSRQLRLLMYSMKVGLAVTVSCFLLIVPFNIQRASMEQAPNAGLREEQGWKELPGEQQILYEEKEDGVLNKFTQASHDVTDIMNQFSNYLLNIIY